MKLTQSLVFSFLAVVAVVAVSPHQVRRAHNHHAIVARAPQPEPVPVAAPVRRQSSRRCRSRNGNTASNSTSTTAAAPTTTNPPLAAVPTPNTPPPVAVAPPPPPPPPPPPVTGNLPSYMIGTQHGQGTFYDTGLGACGITNTDSDFIVAVSHLLFDTFPGYAGGNPNLNPICGRQVSVRYRDRPAITVTITDRCEACQITDLDFSPLAFSQLSDFGAGRINDIQWVWL